MMNEKIKIAVDKILLLSKQNVEFKNEMRRLFGDSFPASNTSNVSSVIDDISEIRAALEIRGNHSIDYSFVNEQRLREQLFIDNLRMENAALNLKDKEIDRFYVFCVNAFYQIENITNYYFHTLYPNINDLLSKIEIATRDDSDGEKSYSFKRSQGKFVEKNVGDISMFYKLNALCNILFPGDIKTKSTLGSLRKVRNEGEHRCMVIWNNKDTNDSLYVFFAKMSSNDIRILLKKVIAAIKEGIQPIKKFEKGNSRVNKYVYKEENRITKISLIDKLERIKKAYDEGDIVQCENIIDVGMAVLASIDEEDEDVKLLQSEFKQWEKIIQKS